MDQKEQQRPGPQPRHSLAIARSHHAGTAPLQSVLLAETNFRLLYAKSRSTTSESEVTIAKRVYTFVETHCKKFRKKAFSVQRVGWQPTTTTSRCWRADVQDGDRPSRPDNRQPVAVGRSSSCRSRLRPAILYETLTALVNYGIVFNECQPLRGPSWPSIRPWPGRATRRSARPARFSRLAAVRLAGSSPTRGWFPSRRAGPLEGRR